MVMLMLYLQLFVAFVAAFAFWVKASAGLMVTVLATGYWLTLPRESSAAPVHIVPPVYSESVQVKLCKEEDPVMMELSAAFQTLNVVPVSCMMSRNRRRSGGKKKKVVFAEHLNLVRWIESRSDGDVEWGKVDWEGDVQIIDIC